MEAEKRPKKIEFKGPQKRGRELAALHSKEEVS